jgi:hypothetical protein
MWFVAAAIVASMLNVAALEQRDENLRRIFRPWRR